MGAMIVEGGPNRYYEIAYFYELLYTVLDRIISL